MQRKSSAKPKNAKDLAWERRFSQLAAFKKKHGHCCPPKSKLALYKWVLLQRRSNNRVCLDFQRERRLDTLGFSWDPFSDRWETQFAQLVAFKKKHGHCSPSYKTGKLGSWVTDQRYRKSKGTIDPEREQRLDELGFSWSPVADYWEINFAKLVKFKKKHGHCNPITRATGSLGGWVSRQREAKANGSLDPEREKRLEALGFSWSRIFESWEQRLAELAAFKEKHGHCYPPHSAGTLANWVATQRKEKANGTLDPQRKRRLNALQFSWSLKKPTDDPWDMRYDELVAFKKKHGHTNPPTAKGTLGGWASRQRQARAKGLLSPQRERRLTKLGFAWSFQENIWETHFADLVEFKKKHGHANPPVSRSSLGNWANTQRQAKTKDRLDPERQLRLNKLGFSWNVTSDSWEAQFAQLAAFKRKHGHASPPRSMKSLHRWASHQRQVKARGRLDPERERRLNKLGFSWDRETDHWETRFAELAAFKEKHGHCRPPKATLGDWVSWQRRLKAKGRLDPERERRFNELGLSWDVTTEFWETQFEQLVAFKKKHGHASPLISAGPLGQWVNRQRRTKAKGLLDRERQRRLDKLGFVWKMDSQSRPITP